VSSFSVFVLMTGHMGALPLAVSNIALSINTLAFMPLVGISIAASTLVGQYQGRREPATGGAGGLDLAEGRAVLHDLHGGDLPADAAGLLLRCSRSGAGAGSRWTSC
jgi:hypothetical protein